MSKDANQEAKDRNLIKRYNIRFYGPDHPWPVHHLRTFQNIRLIGLTQFSSYGNSHGNAEPELWTSETKSRALYLVNAASRLAGNRSSEMHWRLGLERIVYSRFELKIECPDPDCNGRWWRSNTEAASESPGAISAALEKRRNNRRVCSCTAETRMKHIVNPDPNPTFDYRADEMIIHRGEAQLELRGRRPDLVYGLQLTARLDRIIQRISEDIQHRVAGRTDFDNSGSIIEFTPFGDQRCPLVFPFLIAEAKSERGDSFDACERQTAFPIMRLLELQQELQIQAKELLSEQGGPLVWFFANRGEDWRLYGCYLDAEENRKGSEDESGSCTTSYIIHCLWSGRVDSRDGALQILLLVDYIFDWARDIYRPGILQLMKTLRESRGHASQSSDSDIQSKNRIVEAWQNELLPIEQTSQPPHCSESEPLSQTTLGSPSLSSESSLSDIAASETLQTPRPTATFTSTTPPLSHLWCSEMYAKEQRKWQGTDTIDGTFRSQRLVERCFVRLSLDGDTFSRKCVPALQGSNPDRNLRRYSRAILRTVQRTSTTLSEKELQYLESHFVYGKAPTPPTPEPVGYLDHKYVTILHHSCITHDWQLKQSLICILLDEAGLDDLLAHANYKQQIHGQKRDLHSQRQLTVQDMKTLVQEIKLQTPVEILAAAMETSVVEISKEYDPEDCPTASTSPNGHLAEFVGLVQQVVSKDPGIFLASQFFATRQVDNSMWLFRRRLAWREPIEEEEEEEAPFLCTSADLYERLSKSRSGMVLLHSKNIREAGDTQAPEWCIFTLKHIWEPPSTKEQFSIINEFNTSEGFYTINHSSDKVNVGFDWRQFRGRFLASADPNRALTHWKQTLKQINTIHDLSTLAHTHPFELSRCLNVKRGRGGNLDDGGVPKRIKLDLSAVKEEMFEIEMVPLFDPEKDETAVS